MNQISTLIVDDEPLARTTLRTLLAAQPEVRVVGEAADGRGALARIRELRPELVFLDVQMPGLSGIDVLQQLPPAQRPAVIFVTAFDQFAIKAFELHAIDFLLKPYTDERFLTAFDRMRRRLRQPELGELTVQMDGLLKYFAQTPARREGGENERAVQVPLKSGGEIHVFRSDQIKWVEAQGDYLKIYGLAGSVLVRETMGHFLERLPAGTFVRVHKSSIVNLAFVRRLVPIYSGDYRLELTDGTVLRVSRHYREQLGSVLTGTEP